MVEMRLQGFKKDIDIMIENLKHYYNIIEVSKPYKNRNSDLVRVYVRVSANENN